MCDKCEKGIIMKQISLAEYVPIECECTREKWFEGLKKEV